MQLLEEPWASFWNTLNNAKTNCHQQRVRHKPKALLSPKFDKLWTFWEMWPSTQSSMTSISNLCFWKQVLLSNIARRHSFVKIKQAWTKTWEKSRINKMFTFMFQENSNLTRNQTNHKAIFAVYYFTPLSI